MEIVVNMDKLIEYQLSLEAYFLLYCLYYNKEKELIEYTSKCKRIPTNVFEELNNKNYIKINYEILENNIITYSSLNITTTGKNIFEIKNVDDLFEDFRKHYPSRVGIAKRPLHLDLKRCKSLYKKIVANDDKMHTLLCKCADAYYNHCKSSGSERYMQNLATWLHQENYKQYIEDIDKEEVIQSEDI